MIMHKVKETKAQYVAGDKGRIMVTKEFEKVINVVGKLPAKEQKAIAARILAELADEERWQRSFAKSQTTLAKMADKALKDRTRGEVVLRGEIC